MGVIGANPGSLVVSNVTLAVPPPVLPIARDIPVLAFELSTGGLEGVIVQQVRIKGSGTGNEASDVARAYLWEDADGDGLFSSADRLLSPLFYPFAQDDGEAAFALAEAVPAAAVRTWFVTYDLSGSAEAGSDFQVSFETQLVPAPIAATGVLTGQLITATGGLVIGPQVSVKALVGSSGMDQDKSCLASTISKPASGAGVLGILCAALLLMLLAAGRVAGFRRR